MVKYFAKKSPVKFHDKLEYTLNVNFFESFQAQKRQRYNFLTPRSAEVNGENYGFNIS